MPLFFSSGWSTAWSWTSEKTWERQNLDTSQLAYEHTIYISYHSRACVVFSAAFWNFLCSFLAYKILLLFYFVLLMLDWKQEVDFKQFIREHGLEEDVQDLVCTAKYSAIASGVRGEGELRLSFWCCLTHDPPLYSLSSSLPTTSQCCLSATTFFNRLFFFWHSLIFDWESSSTSM